MSRDPPTGWEQRLLTETLDHSGKLLECRDVEVPGLTILGHPELDRIGERVALPELNSGREAVLSRLDPEFAAPGRERLRPLGDPYVSRTPIRLRPTTDGGIRLLCSKTSTQVTADGKLVDDERTFRQSAVNRGIVLQLAQRICLLLHRLDPVPPRGVPSFDLVGESAPIMRLRQEIKRVAPLDLPVLLRGETGTGKELVAEAIHRAGRRRDGPFLAVNMAAIPLSLAAAELFGAAKGAYTGSERRRRGFFDRAQGGTLLLDEIGEAPPELQVLLLRALETEEIQPVGSDESRPIDVRVVAATDIDLENEIAAGRFRAPLLHRLSGYPIDIPPLRERRDDFGRLFFHFWFQELGAPDEAPPAGHGAEAQLPLPIRLFDLLARYPWSGNVRQLRNVARQLAILSRDAAAHELEYQVRRMLPDLNRPTLSPPSESTRSRSTTTGEGTAKPSYRRPSEVSEDELITVLRAQQWLLQPTAAALGISRTALYGLIDKCPAVRKPADLTRREIEECRERCGGDLDRMVDELEVSRLGLERRMKQLELL
ncbi:MAG: sigma-54-dependent Fis family transcriptional regulator [bacterium]|nr:sigma-54-dependent Fis family transcriptional regulator [bacterium]